MNWYGGKRTLFILALLMSVTAWTVVAETSTTSETSTSSDSTTEAQSTTGSQTTIASSSATTSVGVTTSTSMTTIESTPTTVSTNGTPNVTVSNTTDVQAQSGCDSVLPRSFYLLSACITLATRMHVY